MNKRGNSEQTFFGRYSDLLTFRTASGKHQVHFIQCVSELVVSLSRRQLQFQYQAIDLNGEEEFSNQIQFDSIDLIDHLINHYADS